MTGAVNPSEGDFAIKRSQFFLDLPSHVRIVMKCSYSYEISNCKNPHSPKGCSKHSKHPKKYILLFMFLDIVLCSIFFDWPKKDRNKYILCMNNINNWEYCKNTTMCTCILLPLTIINASCLAVAPVTYSIEIFYIFSIFNSTVNRGQGLQSTRHCLLIGAKAYSLPGTFTIFHVPFAFLWMCPSTDRRGVRGCGFLKSSWRPGGGGLFLTYGGGPAPNDFLKKTVWEFFKATSCNRAGCCCGCGINIVT